MSRHHGNVDFAEQVKQISRRMSGCKQRSNTKFTSTCTNMSSRQRGGHFLVMMSNDGRQWRKLSRDEILVSPDKNYMHVYVHKRYGKGGIY
jgi:hypothetical protein